MSDLGRLRWRCRRGMKELDVLLERWLDQYAATADQPELAAFDSLLDLQDPQLARYLLAGELHPATGLHGLIDRIRKG